MENSKQEPYQPLIINGELIGYTLPTIERLEQRKNNLSIVEQLKALEGRTTNQAAISEAQIINDSIWQENYATRKINSRRQIQVNNYDANQDSFEVPLEINTIYVNPNETKGRYIPDSIPRTKETQEERKRLRITLKDLIENHFGTDFNPENLHQKAKLLELIGNYKKKETEIQIPLYQELKIPTYNPQTTQTPSETIIYDKGTDISQKSPRVIIRNIDGTDIGTNINKYE